MPDIPRPCVRPHCAHVQPCPVHATTRPWDTSKIKRGYGRRHEAWRRLVLQKHPLCVGWPFSHGECHPLTEATVADHIVALELWARDPARAAHALLVVLRERELITDNNAIALDAWSLDNGQGLCALCHGKKTRNENKNIRE